jgi:acyl-CoA reductase-like NAD-dependent aldehyde dehydrogenase
MSPSERANCMYKLADLIQKRDHELAIFEALDNGKPFHIAKAVDIAMVHSVIKYYAGWVDKITGKTVRSDGPFFAYTNK